MKPHFLREPEDLTVQSGETAAFSCSAAGDPDPEVSWHRQDPEDDLLGPSPVQLVQPRASVDARSGRLRVESASPSDEGVYVCRAENEAGKVEASASLSVLGE